MPPEEPLPCEANGVNGALTAFTGRLDSVDDRLGRLEKQLGELGRLGLKHAHHVDRLHAENQRLRTGDIAAATTPMVRDLIWIHDDFVKLDPSIHKEIDIARQRVEDVLSRWGVEIHEPRRGEPFDPARQQGVGRVDTDEDDDGTIAVVRRCGFVASDGRVVRAAEVDVFRRREPAARSDSVAASGSVSDPERGN
jgi:molecular chaperone GrpE (heat shock protein)